MEQAKTGYTGGVIPAKVGKGEYDYPVIIIRDVEKPTWEDETKVLVSKYFSHFVVRNDGKSPAVDISIVLLDDNKRLLEDMRETAIGMGETLEYKPLLNQPEGQYYVVC